MNTHPDHTRWTPSEAFGEYERLLVELARVTREHPGDEAAADAVRDLMDAPGSRLSAHDLEVVKDLSSDLYMLEAAERFDPAGVSGTELNQRIALAYATQQWFELLRLLRRHSFSVKRHEVAYLRARAYEQIGARRAAWAFMDYASKLAGTGSNLRALAIDLRYRSGDTRGAIEQAQRELAERRATPVVLIGAASTLLRAIEAGEGSTIDLRAVSEALAEAIANEEGNPQARRAILTSGLAVLGWLQDLQGDRTEAAESYSRFLTQAAEMPGFEKTIRAVAARMQAWETGSGGLIRVDDILSGPKESIIASAPASVAA